MKRTHSKPRGRTEYPENYPGLSSSSSSSSSSSAEASSALSQEQFARLAENPLPPFPPGADFGNDKLLQRFAHEGASVFVGSNFKALVRSCAKRGDFMVLSWILATTGERTLKFHIKELAQANRLQELMEWTRTLPVKLNLRLSCSQLDSHPVELTEGLRDNPNIRGMHIDCMPQEIDRIAKLGFHAHVLDSLATCPSLETLHCRLNERDVRNLAKLLKKTESLTSLSLQIAQSDQPLLERYLTNLAGDIAACRTLTTLHLSSNTPRLDWGPLVSRLPASPYLQKLTLEDWHPTPQHLDAFAQALKQNRTLQSMSFKCSELTDAQAKILAEALRGNSSLNELCCSHCDLKAEGVTALVSVAGSHTRIRKLDLSDNRVQTEAMRGLAFAVLHNQSLESLDLSGCFSDFAQGYRSFFKELVPAIRANGRLRFLRISGINLSQELSHVLSLLGLHEAMPNLNIQTDEQMLDWAQYRATAILKLRMAGTVTQIDASQSCLEIRLAPSSDTGLQQEDWKILHALLGPQVRSNPGPHPANALLPITSSHLEHIDGTRAPQISTSLLASFDLTDDSGALTRITILREDEVSVSDNPGHDPALDRIFPIRDPGNPSLVHPYYADEYNARKCAERVNIGSIEFHRNTPEPVNESDLWNALNKNFPGHRIPSQKALIEMLKESAREEIQATLRGELPPSAQSLAVVKLTAEQCDDENDASLLAGQYGVVLTNYEADQQPSIANGRIAGFFIGGANLLHYAKSSFALRTDGRVDVDDEKTNAILWPVKLWLPNRYGELRIEPMLIAVQIRPVANGKQLRLRYGRGYPFHKQEVGLVLRPVKEKGRTDLPLVPASSTGLKQANGEGMHAVVAPHVDIKPEPHPTNAMLPITSSQFEAIDTTRARYISTSRFTGFDLTDDTGTITRFTALIRDELIISGKQRYEPDFDRVFPIRDPGNPSLVHPDYADENDARKCGEKVRLRHIAFYKDSGISRSESYLWKELRKNFPGHRIPSKEALIAQLKASATAEIEAMLRGEFPPSARSLSVVKLTREQCDDENEADALAGQYGVVLANYAADQQPSLANGRIAGFFAGGMMRTDADDALYKAAYGEQAARDYGAEVRKYGGRAMIGWNPYGGGNTLQFANSTFVLHTDGEMHVDSQRTNAILFPVRLELIDRHGRERTETMLAVIQIRPVAEGKQLKLDYGPDYRLRLQEAGNTLRPVKQETKVH